MVKRIVITAPEPEKIAVELVGKEYFIRAPKAALAMSLADKFSGKADKELTPAEQRDLLEGVDMWIEAAFGKRQAAAVRKRLADPDDRLDFEQIMELVSLTYEEETGDPPTSPRATSD